MTSDIRAFAEEQLALNKKVNLYFLLDHAGMPGLCRKLRGSSTAWWSLFEGTREEAALSVAPVLVLIGESGHLRIPRRLLDWIRDHGQYASAVIMLASPETPASIRSRLEARLNAKLSEDMDAMLRFFDPRVLEQLQKVLSVEQARLFFSPAEKWWYVDRSGKFVGHDAEFDPVEKFELPLALSEDQEFQLLEASEPDQVLGVLRENASFLVSSLPLHTQYQYVVRQIQAARELGLSSTVDFVLYSAAALSNGEDFPASSIWAGVFDDVRVNGIPFTEAVMTRDFF